MRFGSFRLRGGLSKIRVHRQLKADFAGKNAVFRALSVHICRDYRPLGEFWKMFGAFLREAQFTDSQAAFLLKPRPQFRAVGAGLVEKIAQTVGVNRSGFIGDL